MPDEALFLLHWLALVLRMYQVPMYLLLWVSLALSNWWDKGSSERISLIGATVIAFSIFACAFHIIRLPLPSAHPLSPVPYPAVSLVCRAASLIFLCKMFQQHITKLEWANDACLFASCDIYWSAESFLKGPLSHWWIYTLLLLNCWILPGPFLDKKLGEVRRSCWDLGLFLMFRSLPTLGGLNVFNLTFNFIILKIRPPIFFFLPLFRKA